MFSIVEMFSGYALTAGILAFVLWPLIILVEFLVGAFLYFASEEVIDFEGTRFTRGSKLWRAVDTAYWEWFLSAVVWWISVLVLAVYFLVSTLKFDNTLHEAATALLSWIYSAGVWVSPLVAFAAVLGGIFYGIRYATRISVAAGKALEAVKKHEKKYHSK